MYLKQKLIDIKITKTELVNRLNKFNSIFLYLDIVTLSRWISGKTKPSNYKQLLVYSYFNENIIDFIVNNKELSTSSSQMEKLLDSHFKRKMYPNYDYPKININNIVYSTEIKNKKEDTRNSFSFFYHNFELYEELFNFVDINDLKIQSYLFKEIDVSHKIVTSHIQVSFLNEVNSFYYKKFLRNKNINIIDNNEMSVIDISFIRNRISFENLLYHLIITILKLKLENNNIYILLSGRYFTEVLEQLGGIQLGIIPELEDNIYIYEVETIKLISHRYVINIIQSRNQYFSSI